MGLPCSFFADTLPLGRQTSQMQSNQTTMISRFARLPLFELQEISTTLEQYDITRKPLLLGELFASHQMASEHFLVFTRASNCENLKSSEMKRRGRQVRTMDVCTPQGRVDVTSGSFARNPVWATVPVDQPLLMIAMPVLWPRDFIRNLHYDSRGSVARAISGRRDMARNLTGTRRPLVI